MTSATSDSSTGVGQHYWTVTLTPPSGASAALVQFVTMGQDAIQTAVDLLGRGMPDLPPVMDDLLTSVTYQDLGEGTANSDYQALLTEIENRQTSLLSSDNQVLQASITVSASGDVTLQYIESVVDQLQSEFNSITGTLSAAENQALMEQIGEAVDMVNARVTSVYETNQSIAGVSGSGGGTGSGTGSSTGTYSSTGSTYGGTTSSGSSSGDSGNSLMSLLEISTALAAPLIQLAPELLKDLKPNQTNSQHNSNSQQNSNQSNQNTASANAGQPSDDTQHAATAASANPGQPNATPAVTNSPTTTSPTTGSNQSTPAN